MELLCDILKIGGFVGGFILFIIFGILASEESYYPIRSISDVVVGVIIPIAATIMIVSSISLSIVDYNKNKILFYESIEDYVNNKGYTIYINDTEVDLQLIVIEKYSISSITIDEEHQEIHITKNN